MIKLTGNVSRKVPIPGTDFSSQSFGAGMEVEVSNEATTEVIQGKFKEMYNLLETSVKEQIAANGNAVHKEEKEEPKKARKKGVSRQPASEKAKPASPRQRTLIERLAVQVGLTPEEKAKALGVKTLSEASQQIKKLLDTPKKQGVAK